jgi:hypothetical protein
MYGEIARLDVALASISGIMLLTFYDSRAMAQLLLDMPGRAELCPGQPHDFRAVKVNQKRLGREQKLEVFGSFSAYGEVANCSVEDGDVVVEYFDMRAAQGLLTAAGACGEPWTTLSQKPPSVLTSQGLPAAPGLLPGPTFKGESSQPKKVSVKKHTPLAPSAASQLAVSQMPDPTPSPMSTSSLLMRSLSALSAMGHVPEKSSDPNYASNMAALAQALQEVTELAQVPPGLGENVHQSPTKESPAPPENSAKVVRTKVTNKEFSKYDIDPEKIQNGDDQRTTVMVRNLTGPNARQDFLNFLVICGLSERYTFFYMPYKEHRNVLAGFAFMNFVAPHDVLALCNMLKEDVWRNVYHHSNTKSPVVSFARFQGHEQLVQHFSSSAVLHEQAPEKRPIFRPFAGQGKQESKPKKVGEKTGHAKEPTTTQPAIVTLPEETSDSLASDVPSHVKLGIDSKDDPLNGSIAGA